MTRDAAFVHRSGFALALLALSLPAPASARDARFDSVSLGAKAVQSANAPGVSAQTAFGLTRAREELPELDGRGTVAAVIDSGVDPQRADLAGGKVIAFRDLVNGRTEPYDDLGHGSLVAGILAGSGASGPEGRGAAPAASLVAVKVVDEHAQSSLELIAQGIRWAVEHRDAYGIDAINLSIGDPAGCGDGTDVASQAIDAAVAAGIVVVAAAGNAGPASCTIKAPAAAASALTVGAMADTGAGGFSLAWFSSRGPTASGESKPDVLGPGVGVKMVGAGGAVIEGSGTSAAAPFVTGVALLARQLDPALTPAGVKALFERTAVDWGLSGRDDDHGAGRLDVYAALRAAGAPLATPPAVPAHRAWSGALQPGETVTHELDVAAGSFPLAVALNGPSAEFGLRLRDASGADVGTTTWQPAPSRQGDITLTAPAPGRYTATVAAGTGSGAYTLDVSGALAPADTLAPALTLDALTPARSAGAAGSAFGDFPGVVVHVAGRRIGAVPVLGRWEVPLALGPGTYTVAAEQGDSAGNVTRTPARTLVVGAPDPTPTATPSATPAATPGRTPTATPAATTGRTPTAAPASPPAIPPVTTPSPPAHTIRITVPRQRLASVLRRGLAVRVRCDCRVALRLSRGKRVAGRRVGSGRMRLSARTRRSLTRSRRATFRLTASSPGAATVTRRVVVKR